MKIINNDIYRGQLITEFEEHEKNRIIEEASEFCARFDCESVNDIILIKNNSLEDLKEEIKQIYIEDFKESKSDDKKLTWAKYVEKIENEGNENLFGNIDGSRFYNYYKAEVYFLGLLFNDYEEVTTIFNDFGYNGIPFEKGFGALDVCLCEILSSEVLTSINKNDIKGGTKQ